MVYRHEPSWCIGANGQRGGVDFAQSFRDQKQLRRVARIAAKPETAVSPLKDPATPQRAIAIPECSHAPVLCRNGGQGYPLPVILCHQSSSTMRLAPRRRNHCASPNGTKKLTSGKRFRDTANGRVIKVIVMIVRDNHCIKLRELFHREREAFCAGARGTVRERRVGKTPGR